MIEISILSWLQTFALLALASITGTKISNLMPWSERAREVGVPFGFGLALAPFLTGVLAVSALALLPTATHSDHLIYIFSILFLLAAPIPLRKWKMCRHHTTCGTRHERWALLFALLCVTWLISLLYDTLFMPLTQNDALEYMTVGRNLFESRTIASYPALDSITSISGFYGPWTHPPLYVSMIYLFNCIQGHADFPGAARVIAPWFLATSFVLVVYLGRIRNHATGYLSGLLFLSPPLLFLGAGSALIDSLPVAGVTLLLATLVHLNTSGLRYGFWNGLPLGLGLWSHSQAILFLPLWIGTQFLLRTKKISEQLQTISAAIATALLIAGWPYFRNYLIFGSPISDNPEVFALPKLNWPEYFEVARGYASIANKIQYGFFKGWFMIEAYSIIFWLMSIALIFTIACFLQYLRTRRPQFADIMNAASTNALGFYIVFILIYFAGVAVSITIGVDLMIRNERYMLVLLPPACLLTGYWMNSTTEAFPLWKGRGKWISIALILFASVNLYQLKAVGGYKSRYGIKVDELLNSDRDKLSSWPPFVAVDYLYTHTPADALVLSMKPADMYFANRKMISYLDPRMIAVYLDDSMEGAFRKLKDLGITYIHTPDYTLPPLYNSQIASILARPDLVDLVFSAGGHQVYRLKEPEAGNKTAFTFVQDVGPSKVPWTRSELLVLGGRKGLFRFPQNSHPLPPSGLSNSISTTSLFPREYTTILLSGGSSILEKGHIEDLIPSKGSTELILTLRMAGYGSVVGIHIVQFDKNGKIVEPFDVDTAKTIVGKAIDPFRVGELLLPEHSNQSQLFEFKLRFQSYPQTAGLRIALEHRGSSKIELSDAKLAVVNLR